jgi:AmiR/NasT family two-component response regulator
MTESTKYKVLVVEDEGLIARDIAGRLEALGHEVVGIAGSAEALAFKCWRASRGKLVPTLTMPNDRTRRWDPA